ncbi:MAG TPA: hypothetical protein VFV90_07605 [Usitatibacter sp.]|nr:hypothetical protein [Usitatibacter sp.]
MTPELRHELQKLNGDLAGAIEHLPNPLMRLLARAIVERLMKILYLIAETKSNG